MEQQLIPLTQLVRNEGQIEGLPVNPRRWTKAEINRLKKSIRETPELMDARGLLVYPFRDKYIILGGNMRYTALAELNVSAAPCIILPNSLSVAKLKEIVIKDNGSFGEWDFDALANDWDDIPLSEWGIDTPSWEEGSDESSTSPSPESKEPTEPIVCTRQRGEVWSVGSQEIMCAGCLSQKEANEKLTNK